MLPDPPTPDTGARAVAYGRLSEEDDESTYARHRQQIEAAIERHGWDWDPDRDWFEDYDRSAWNPRVTRHDFERLLDDGLARADVVVFWKWDRFIRSVRRDLGRALDAADEHGVLLYSVMEPSIDNRSAHGELTLTVMSAMAQHESRTTSIRVSNSQEWMLRQGRWVGGHVPFGWRVVDRPDGPGSELVLHDPEASRLRDAVRRVLRGDSVRSIVTGWNDDGVPTTKSKSCDHGLRICDTCGVADGGGWATSSLLTILRNPRLVGHQRWSGDLVRDEDGIPVVVHEPLLDIDTFERLQATLRQVGDEVRSQRGGQRRSTLLSGLLACGLCGASMSGRNPAGPDDRSATYQCSARANGGEVRCGGVNISVRLLDSMVVRLLLGRLDSSDLTGSSRRVQERTAATTDSDPDQARIDQLRAQVDRLEADRLAGMYDDTDGARRYHAAHRRLTGELDELLDARARWTAGRSRPQLAEVLHQVDDVAVLFDDDDRRQLQRAVLAAAVERIVVHDTTGRRFDPGRVCIVGHDGSCWVHDDGCP